MPHERRHFIRVGFDAPAQLITPTAMVVVQVLDLSLKGALVIVPANAALASGMRCQLTMALADTDTQIAMWAEVAHLQDDTIGLLCTDIDLDSVTHLRRLIELQLGDPALLERDLVELIAG